MIGGKHESNLYNGTNARIKQISKRANSNRNT